MKKMLIEIIIALVSKFKKSDMEAIKEGYHKKFETIEEAILKKYDEADASLNQYEIAIEKIALVCQEKIDDVKKVAIEKKKNIGLKAGREILQKSAILDAVSERRELLEKLRKSVMGDRR